LHAMRVHLGREADWDGPFTHLVRHFTVREVHNAKGELDVADRLTVKRNAGLGDGVSRALVNKRRVDRDLLTGCNERPKFRVLYRRKERHALEPIYGNDQPA